MTPPDVTKLGEMFLAYVELRTPHDRQQRIGWKIREGFNIVREARTRTIWHVMMDFMRLVGLENTYDNTFVIYYNADRVLMARGVLPPHPRRGVMNCQAVIDDRDRPAYHAPMQRISVPGDKPCSRTAHGQVGHLHLCRKHFGLACEGLIDERGRVASRADIRAVRKHGKFPDGLYTWWKTATIVRPR